jgi:hypothetical protein
VSEAECGRTGGDGSLLKRTFKEHNHGKFRNGNHLEEEPGNPGEKAERAGLVCFELESMPTKSKSSN